MRKFSFCLALTVLSLVSVTAEATWSVIAVDRDSGEIGIAGASCTFDVQGIASIVPGQGAIVVQAASNYFARMTGVDLMEESTIATDILNGMRDEKFEPERQQYGVVTLPKNEVPQVYSGSQISKWSGSKQGKDFAVLGNILVGESVISDAFTAFDGNRKKALAERLMLALTAGARAGGDSRCGEQHARSAFISVFDPQTGAINKLSVHGLEPGGAPAVKLLNAKFKHWHDPKP